MFHKNTRGLSCAGSAAFRTLRLRDCLKAMPHNSAAALVTPFPPSASCKNLDLPPGNLRFLPSRLTKNSLAIAPLHLCGIALENASKRLPVLSGCQNGLFDNPGTGTRPRYSGNRQRVAAPTRQPFLTACTSKMRSNRQENARNFVGNSVFRRLPPLLTDCEGLSAIRERIGNRRSSL